MDNIISFFIQNKFKLTDYFKQVKINQKKTIVKHEVIENHKLSISFLIEGEPQKKILPFEDKVKRLFNTKENLTGLDQFLAGINLPYYFTFSPGSKISKENEPTIHRFQINIIVDKA